MSLPNRWMSLLGQVDESPGSCRTGQIPASLPWAIQASSIPSHKPLTLLCPFGNPFSLKAWRACQEGFIPLSSSLCCHTSHDYVVQDIFNLCICYFSSSTMDHRGLDFVAFVLYPEPNTTGAPEHSIFWACCQPALDRWPGAQCATRAKRKAPAQVGSSLNSKSSEEPGHRMRRTPGLQVASHSSRREHVLPRQTII